MSQVDFSHSETSVLTQVYYTPLENYLGLEADAL